MIFPNPKKSKTDKDKREGRGKKRVGKFALTFCHTQAQNT